MRNIEQDIVRDVETGIVDLERSIGCALRTVFWVLFVVYTAVLALLGWALYTGVLVHQRIPLPDSSKDAVIVGLSVVVLGTILAAITRDQLLHVIFHRVRRQRNK
jgi:Na+/proline symporter